VSIIVDHISRTYCYGIYPMEIEDSLLIDKINPTFIALTIMAIHHFLSAWKRGEWRITPQSGPGGGAQRKWETRNINQVAKNEHTAVFCHLNADFQSSMLVVQAKKLDNVCSIIRWKIYSTGIDPAMVQPHYDLCSMAENSLDYLLEKPRE